MVLFSVEARSPSRWKCILECSEAAAVMELGREVGVAAMASRREHQTWKVWATAHSQHDGYLNLAFYFVDSDLTLDT